MKWLKNPLISFIFWDNSRLINESKSMNTPYCHKSKKISSIIWRKDLKTYKLFIYVKF